MSTKASLNFTIGSNFGQLIHRIAYEKITVDLDPRKAYDLLESAGVPPEKFNSVLEGKLLICADEEKQVFYLKPRDEVEDSSEYMPTNGYEGWLTRKLKDQSEFMNDLLSDIRNLYSGCNQICITLTQDDLEELFPSAKMFDDVKFDGHIYLSPRRIIDAYYNNEEKLLELLEYNSDNIIASRMSKMVNDISVLERETERAEKLLKLALWLVEQYGYKDPKPYILQLSKDTKTMTEILYYTKCSDQKKVDEYLKIEKSIDASVMKTFGTSIDEYIESQKEADSYQLKPVDIRKNWDAGFIAPTGEVYAMNGQTYMFIHLRIAEKIAEMLMIAEKKDEPIDWTISRMGWVRFHSGKILWDAPLADALGQASQRLTDAQKRKIIEYGKYCCNGNLSLGLHGKFVTTEEFKNASDEDLADWFSM